MGTSPDARAARLSHSAVAIHEAAHHLEMIAYLIPVLFHDCTLHGHDAIHVVNPLCRVPFGCLLFLDGCVSLVHVFLTFCRVCQNTFRPTTVAVIVYGLNVIWIMAQGK